MRNDIDKLPPGIILWGGTGQAKVVRPIIESRGSSVAAVFDDTPDLPPPFPEVPLYRGMDEFREWIRSRPAGSRFGFCITIGNPHGRVRLKYHDLLSAEGLIPVTVTHHSAQIAPNATIGHGCQFMAGAIVNPEAVLGRQCIVNTKASVDHECILGDGVEIAPGATLCGLVVLGANVWIGAGATVLPRIRVGEDSIVGAGAVVTRNVPAGVTVVGVPAKPVQRSIKR